MTTKINIHLGCTPKQAIVYRLVGVCFLVTAVAFTIPTVVVDLKICCSCHMEKAYHFQMFLDTWNKTGKDILIHTLFKQLELGQWNEYYPCR